MRDHITHHDDCGCHSAALKERIATLEAELADARNTERVQQQMKWDAITDRDAALALASTLRDALANAGLHDVSCEMVPGTCRTCTALAQTPAQSLAAHDAEVLERARDAAHNAIHDAVYEKVECDRIKAAVDEAIRALAAQAATLSVPDGTSEVKP